MDLAGECLRQSLAQEGLGCYCKTGIAASPIAAKSDEWQMNAPLCHGHSSVKSVAFLLPDAFPAASMHAVLNPCQKLQELSVALIAALAAFDMDCTLRAWKKLKEH